LALEPDGDHPHRPACNEPARGTDEFRRHEPLQINRHGWFGHAQRIGDRRRMRALVNRRQAVTVKRVTA